MQIRFRRFAIDHHLTKHQIRGSGMLLMSLGLLLAGSAALGMAALLQDPFPQQWLSPGLALVQREAGAEPAGALLIAGWAFAFLALIAATAICLQGLWQMVVGSRSAAVIGLLMCLGALLLAGAVSASILLGRPIGRLIVQAVASSSGLA
ncbi:MULTISPECIES: hypothetical protein [Roseomonadaceae]|uniref:DUF2975 domain-containing protein n=1 Tax=Falsiroseomonas oleicola TaxID=2801474 RepID=A0ABS6H9C1_9PROT|nr:hypothetical protein [Roseomonas oleicola]MBU8544076.1 hypothetical protein [Roseomonas oleicola]